MIQAKVMFSKTVSKALANESPKLNVTENVYSLTANSSVWMLRKLKYLWYMYDVGIKATKDTFRVRDFFNGFVEVISFSASASFHTRFKFTINSTALLVI